MLPPYLFFIAQRTRALAFFDLNRVNDSFPLAAVGALQNSVYNRLALRSVRERGEVFVYLSLQSVDKRSFLIQIVFLQNLERLEFPSLWISLAEAYVKHRWVVQIK